jgi:type IV pilus assembly protein PilV
MTMRSANFPRRPPARERGSFLLEALVAILIVAFGILGLVGLQARVLQQVDDAQFRSEAVFMTNTLIGQMWTSPYASLAADFSGPGAGARYTEFRDWVQQRLPGASGQDPTVVVTPNVGAPGTDVTITVFWKPPGEISPSFHQFQATATIGQN